MDAMWKLYAYSKCSTCRTAVRALAAAGIDALVIPIREQPPTMEELKRALIVVNGAVRRLFNTSGADYRTQRVGELLERLDPEKALELLASNGNLVKRPFLVTPRTILVGYNAEVWMRELSVNLKA